MKERRVRDWRKEQNDMLIARIQGVPARRATKLEAMMDQSNPNVIEGNDNVIRTPTEAEIIEAVAQAMCEADGVRPWKKEGEHARRDMEFRRDDAKRFIAAARALAKITS